MGRFQGLTNFQRIVGILLAVGLLIFNINPTGDLGIGYVSFILPFLGIFLLYKIWQRPNLRQFDFFLIGIAAILVGVANFYNPEVAAGINLRQAINVMVGFLLAFELAILIFVLGQGRIQ